MSFKVPFSYLQDQFASIDDYLADVGALVRSGDFTLGAAVEEFETKFARVAGISHAVGVGSGTDALALSLHALGVGPGDEVITAPNTFIATVGAIVQVGARPVFVDIDDAYVIDPSRIEDAITEKTRAIMPVHYSGNVADMPTIAEIAKRRGLHLVEDACQAIGGAIDGARPGSWSASAGFSLHPLKNLNVWGDAGVIVTESAELATRLRLLRNHGLSSRDDVEIFGWNTRLDSLQAVVGLRLLPEYEAITQTRIAHAARYDAALTKLGDHIEVPPRREGTKHVYHLYIVRAKKRDELLAHLNAAGIEAKIHYPIPVHLQPAASHLGYKRGDFPITERDADSVITLPAHQHLHADQIDFTVEQVRAFYD